MLLSGTFTMDPVYVCPRCGFQGAASFSECPKCGIVVQKYLALRALGESAKLTHRSPAPTESDASLRQDSDSWIIPAPEEASPAGTILRALLLAVLVIWGAMLVLSPIPSNAAGNSFLHMINLPFHEAGHIIFAPFGQFISSLGGTLGQLLVPLICGGVLLWKTSDPFGASVCLWWFGENFIDIAPYINDARAGALPLIGGNTGRGAPYGFHDWEFLLNETGLLRYDHQIATSAHGLGTLLMLAAVVWGALIVVRCFQLRRARTGYIA